jgi:hypothetical protein
MLYHLNREVLMRTNILRGLVAVAAGILFLFFFNSVIFFENLELKSISSNYILFLVIFCLLPLFLSLMIFGEDLSMSKNLLINGAYFLSGLLIAQGAFVAFNDTFVDRNTIKAYVKMQEDLNIADAGVYGPNQLSFLKDKTANDFKALSKYVAEKDTYKVASSEKTASLILLMTTNTDPVLKEQFNKILEDKVVSAKEFEDFNAFVIQHKMEQLK